MKQNGSIAMLPSHLSKKNDVISIDIVQNNSTATSSSIIIHLNQPAALLIIVHPS
jgi:hypothetical protein